MSTPAFAVWGCIVLGLGLLALVWLWASDSIKTPALSLGACPIVVVMLALMSLGAVEPNEYGLVFNWITKSIRPTVHHGGMHMIGFWNEFVAFPATVQTVEFSSEGVAQHDPLHTRTKEGLALHLSISCQYKLEAENLPQLYALTNVQYESLFRRIMREEILQGAALYEGPQYWLQRKDIGEHMRTLVDAKLRESYSSLWGLQLMIIDLPDRYEDSITETQVQNQIIKTRGSQQMAARIRADTEVMFASFQRDISIVQAGAQANFTLQTKLAEAEASKRKIAAEAEALEYARDQMHLTGSGVVAYTKMSAYGQLQNATFLANLPGILPTMNVGGSGRPAASSASAASSRPRERPTQEEEEEDGSFLEQHDEGTLSDRSAQVFLQKGERHVTRRHQAPDFDSLDDSSAPILGVTAARSFARH